MTKPATVSEALKLTSHLSQHGNCNYGNRKEKPNAGLTSITSCPVPWYRPETPGSPRPTGWQPLVYCHFHTLPPYLCLAILHARRTTDK